MCMFRTFGSKTQKFKTKSLISLTHSYIYLGFECFVLLNKYTVLTYVLQVT